MKKNIILSGILGAIVIFAWTVISSSFIPLSGDMPKEVPDDKDVHTLLKAKLPESGIYWMPGHAGQEEGLYPDYENEPIFYVFYAGTTPSTMTATTIVEILSMLLTPMVAAWLLSMASERVLARYARRVFFVTGIGLLFAIYGDLYSPKPLDLVLLSSISNLIAWTIVGLVLGWRIRPESVAVSGGAVAGR